MRRGLTAAPQLRVAQQARFNILHSSQYKKNQFPHQMIVPKSIAGQSYGSLLKSRSARVSIEAPPSSKPTEADDVQWDDANGSPSTGADILVARDGPQEVVHTPSTRRLPLDVAAKAELRGDYLTEAGDGQSALEYFGLVMDVYEAHYTPYHNQLAKLRIKLARAFRMTGRTKSAVLNANEALDLLDKNPRPQVEHICEALLELGMAHEAAGDDVRAAASYEDVITVANAFHDFGASHRGLRGLPIAARRFYLNIVSKMRYYSPYEFDRVFALVDMSLSQAEQCHRRSNNQEGVVRVLDQRKIVLDRKFFNMRDYAYKIRNMRGHNHKKSYSVSARPSADEILAYTPTIHQIHYDFTKLDTAPLGKEHLVQVGANAKRLDDGDPERFFAQRRQLKESARSAARAFVEQQWDSAAGIAGSRTN